MKDNFSTHSHRYALCRPTFPKEVFEFIFTEVRNFSLAWDVATGNGQAARFLAARFDQVMASDISQNQLDHAVQLPNIEYRLESAGHTSLHDRSVDLVMVSQAAHWFDFGPFYSEVRRVAKPGALISLLGYGLIYSDDAALDELIRHFYFDITGPYWDAERKYVDDQYRTLPFPFKQIDTPSFQMEYLWPEDQLLGYFSTWSAVQHYLKERGSSPLTPELEEAFRKACKQKACRVKFPVFMKVARIT